MDLSSVSAFFSSAGDRLTAALSGLSSYALANLTLDLVIRLLVLYFFVIWAAFVVWVIKDITNRTSSILLQVFSILLVIVLTPIFGLPIYLLIRPSSTLFERYYFEGEEESAETEDSDATRCTHCDLALDGEYRYCPRCGTETAYECAGCGRTVRTGLRETVACPYCGAGRGDMPTAPTEPREKSKTKEETVVIGNAGVREVTVTDVPMLEDDPERFAQPDAPETEPNHGQDESPKAA